MKHRIAICAAALLCVCVMLCIMPARAATETSGSCGENVTWVFNEQTNTLTISGTGNMDNGPFGNKMRWAPLYDKIHYIVIEEGITSICDYAFEGSTELKEVTIPKSVTYIGESAFERSGLHRIDLHDEITYMGTSAFEWSSLEEVVIPSGITELEFGLFRTCKKLRNVVLHDGITKIGNDVFRQCSSLERITIPDSVTFLGAAFLECTALTDITLGNGVTIIRKSCFQNCTALKEINLPDSVQRISSTAFQNCRALEKITIGAGLTSFESNAFLGCDNLRSICISADNTTFCSDDGVVYNKDKTQLVRIPTGFAGDYRILDGTQFINGEAGFGCGNLTGLTIPGSVKEIGRSAFADCIGLKALHLSYGLEIIRAEAFRGCENLKILLVPETVTRIDNSAFLSCETLHTVEFFGNLPYLEDYVFSSVRADVYYPANDVTWETDLSDIGFWLTWIPGCGGNHTFLDVEAVEPACGTDGKTAYTYCSTCGFVSVYPTILPATDHSFGPWSYITPAGTPANEHIVEQICEICGYVHREHASRVDLSQLPEVPTDPNAQQKTPIKLDIVPIMVIVIAVVAGCFVGIEVYLLRKKKLSKN